jgi:TonB family protein
MFIKKLITDKKLKNSQAEVKKFETDSDKRLTHFFIVCLSLCLALGLHFTFVELVVPSLKKFVEFTSVKTTINIVDPYKKTEPKKQNLSQRNNTKRPGKKPGSGGRPRGKGRRNAIAGVGVLQYITSQSKSNAHNAYVIMQRSFSDVKKSMDKIAYLKTSGDSRFGDRPGKTDAPWNDGYSPGGSGGIDEGLANLWNPGDGIPRVKAKGKVLEISESVIDMGQMSSRRSAASILRVVRSHMSGLRHAYNKHLKMNPGFNGKLHIKFEIAPSGRTVRVSIVGSSTGIPAFDREIKDKVRRWRFEPINAKGNDIVTIPFTFSE